MPVSNSGKKTIAIIVGVLVLGFVAVVGYSMFAAGNFVHAKLEYVTESLASRSGVSIFLVRGVAFIVTIPFFMALASIAKNFAGLLNLMTPALDPLSIYRSKAGLTVVVYIGVFWIAMWGASREAYAYKFCAETPEGLATSDSPGKDPVYGVPFKPCTPEDAKEARAKTGELKEAHEIVMPAGRRVEWFNGATGKARVWYNLRDDGYHYFDTAGNDPQTGEQVKPVTSAVVRGFYARQRTAGAQQSAARERLKAEEAKREQGATDEAAASRAQSLFESQDYKAALQACKQVLSHDAANESCLQVKHDASTELAHKLVDEGQAELQRAQYDRALRSATEAVQLDPTNEPAKRLQALASTLKPKMSLN